MGRSEWQLTKLAWQMLPGSMSTMGPIKQTGEGFHIHRWGTTEKRKKLYNIADVGKDFHFTNGFLPGCRSVVRGLSFAYLSKKLFKLERFFISFHVERVYSIIRYLTNYRTENSQAKTEKDDKNKWI